jgi:subtilisin family serine protease
MSRQFRTAALGLTLAFCASIAVAFVDAPILVPDHPVAGQTVSVSIRSGVCDTFADRDGYPQITQTGNAIRIVVPIHHIYESSLCQAAIGTKVYPVGVFPAGSYTLQVDQIYPAITGGGDVVETLGTLAFDVTAAAPGATAVPTLSQVGIAVLAVVLLVLAFARDRRRGTALLLLAAVGMSSTTVRAQAAPAPPRLYVLLSEEPGAPSPADVIDYLQSAKTASPPVAALSAQNPQRAYYLLSVRATGDFLAYLQANPESPRAQLERYLVVEYPQGADLASALSTWRKTTFVEAAYPPHDDIHFSSVELTQFSVNGTEAIEDTQYGRDAMDVDAAWQVTGGYALIGDIDSGLAVDHPALRQFSSSGQYVGGNFIPASALDIGNWPNAPDYNVDEEEPVPISMNSPCNKQHQATIQPGFAGHGTHVAGILAANAAAGLGVEGVCKHCGIAEMKVGYTFCEGSYPYRMLVDINHEAVIQGTTFLADTGAQVINMSFGNMGLTGPYCTNNPSDPWCDAIATAYERDIVLVGASGNARDHIQFPASDSRVIAVGGFDTSLNLWDESPGNNLHCPNHMTSECGSNYTTVPGDPKQELMAAAKSVLSTVYPGYDWNPQIFCGDSIGGPSGDGVGQCTGTSMSSPHVAGIAGLLRSINPLAPVGNPTFNPLLEKASVRSVLASTTFEAQNNQPWSPTFGYGRPDAGAAARKMIGQVAGATARNRATPLFRLHSTAAKDYADVTSPQYAISLVLNQANAYQPTGSAVPGYGSFPIDPAHGPLPAPKAAIYVLTTEVQPRNEWPSLVPLYLMDKNFAAGSRDFMLVTTTADIQTAHNAGYNLRNIQGYIYATCTPEPGCMPPGTQKMYRECKTADNDCATFLESEKSTFEANGYTSAYPSGSSKVLGYAYPAGDTDGDGLPNAFEYVVGTNPNAADSDGDGTHDAYEFPMTGVPVSDPCWGGSLGAKFCGADVIFKNAFDFP